MKNKKIDELSELELSFRALIYAVEVKDKKHPDHPVPLGEQYLQHTLAQAKETAKASGIPLVKITY